jgi:hypothetical protein
MKPREEQQRELSVKKRQSIASKELAKHREALESDQAREEQRARFYEWCETQPLQFLVNQKY